MVSISSGTASVFFIKLPPDFTVLVTGAGKGLGWHISTAFAKAGASNMVIASRTRADLEKLTAELKEINPNFNVLARTCDTTKGLDVERLAGESKQCFDRRNVAVANAGIISKYLADADGSNPGLPVGIVEGTDFEHVIETNLVGSYRIAKHFLPLLARSHQGPQSFMVIKSVATHGVDSAIAPIAYNMSKFANNRMVESIHNDHGDKDGVLTFPVHPGAVLTPQTELHNTTQRRDFWDKVLTDDIGLCAGFLTWLTKERRELLSGRYLSATWDVEELELRKDKIVDGGKLKFQMVV